MKRLLSFVLSLASVGIGVYGALALWYHPPFGAAMRDATAAAWLLFSLLLGYRALPFEIVPTSMALLLAVFVISAALASRFGRLGSVELHPAYRKRAGHLIEIDTHCAEYAKRIDRQGRPLTRLDLEELGAIYLKSKREHEQKR